MEYELYNFNKANTSFKFYGGSDKKSSIKIDGEDYMIKFASPLGKRNELNTSISNSVISEFIACHIIESIGYPVQKTILGMINDELVVACKDFVPEGKELVEFSKIENRIVDSSDRGRVPSLENIEKIYEDKIFSDEFRQQAIERYWDIFIIDSYIGNFDRHCGNWGFLVNKNTGELENAPIYDCGSSLYPQMSDNSLKTILESEDEIQKRIDLFPKAALTLTSEDKSSKVGYKEMILSGNKECENALLRVAPKVSISKTHEIINKTPKISNIRKEFYKKMLDERYKQIILEPYLRLAKERNLEIPDQIKKNQKRLERSSSFPSTAFLK